MPQTGHRRLSRRSFPLVVFAGLLMTPSVMAREATPAASPIATPSPASGLIPMWDMDGSRSNRHPGPMPSGRLAHSGTIAGGVRLFGRVLAAPNHLVALGADDDLNWVLDRATGERLWSFPSTSRSVKPFIHDDRVFSIMESYNRKTDSRTSRVEAYALETETPPDGGEPAARTAWDSGEIQGLLGITPVRDAILIHTGDGLSAFHPATAEPLWSWLDEVRSDFITGFLADDREVWAAQWRITTPRIVALDVTTGEPRLEFDSNTSLVCMTPDLVLVRDEIIMSAFDRTDGSLRWRARLSGRTDDAWAVATNGEFIVVGTRSDLLAFHADSGEEAWAATGVADFLQKDQVVICDQSVVLPAGEDVVVIDLHTGELVQRVDIGPRSDRLRPREVSIVDERILVSSVGGIAVITGA